jgi:hypothetical protein
MAVTEGGTYLNRIRALALAGILEPGGLGDNIRAHCVGGAVLAEEPHGCALGRPRQRGVTDTERQIEAARLAQACEVVKHTADREREDQSIPAPRYPRRLARILKAGEITDLGQYPYSHNEINSPHRPQARERSRIASRHPHSRELAGTQQLGKAARIYPVTGFFRRK